MINYITHRNWCKLQILIILNILYPCRQTVLIVRDIMKETKRSTGFPSYQNFSCFACLKSSLGILFLCMNHC